MYTTILFDLDGTLTNPKLGITKSVQYALAKMGITEANLENPVKFIGPPLQDSFREFYAMDETEAWQAVAYYREYFSEHGIYENELYPEIPELLAELRQAGKELIVASSKPTVFVERVLKHFKIDDYFSLIVGGNLDGTRTAKDEVIGYILANRSGIKPETTVMVGDRSHDIAGARVSGIDSIGVTFGFGSAEELREAGATYVAESVAELRKFIG